MSYVNQKSAKDTWDNSLLSSFQGHYLKICYWKTGEPKPLYFRNPMNSTFLLSVQRLHINLWQQKNLWTISISSYFESDIERQKLKLTGPLKHDSKFLTVFLRIWQFRSFLISPEPQKTSTTKSDSGILETRVDYSTYSNWNFLNFCLNLSTQYVVFLV